MDGYTKPDPESLMQKASCPSSPAKEGTSLSSFLVSALSFGFLTFTCAQAVYKSWKDTPTVSFVISAYSSLVLLLWCLRRLDNLPRGEPSKAVEEKRLKLAVLLISLFLNGIFSYRVGDMLPTPLAVVVWAVAGSTAIAGCCLFIMFGDDRS